MSDLLARLIAAGTPADLIGEVAMLVARSELDREAIEARRSKDRERQANRRHVMSRDTADVTGGLPALDKSPQTPKINPTPLVHTHETRPRGAAWPCPEGVNPDHWRDFLGNRKRKKLVNTETAHSGVLRDLENLTDADWPPGRLVELAAAKGWGSINKPDGYQNGRTNGMARTGKPGAGSSGIGLIDAIRESRANREAVPWDADLPAGMQSFAGMG